MSAELVTYFETKAWETFRKKPSALVSHDDSLASDNFCFCNMLHEGKIAYRHRRLRKWPAEKKEREALKALKTDWSPSEGHGSPFYDPFYSHLRRLFPSALHEYEKGNRYAVFKLACAMPGLLTAIRKTAKDPDLPKVSEKYLQQIEKFQQMFCHLLDSGELKLDMSEKRKRKRPVKREKVHSVVQRLLTSGVDKKLIYSLLPKLEAVDYYLFKNLKKDISDVKTKLEKEEKAGLRESVMITEGLRRNGIKPGRTVLAASMAEWILTQYYFRLELRNHIKNLAERIEYVKNSMPAHALRDDLIYKDLIRDWKTWRKYEDTPLLPTQEELVANAEKVWPGMKGSGDQPVKMASDILEYFQKALSCFNNNVFEVQRLLIDVAWRYATSGKSSATRFINQIERSNRSR